MAPRTPSPQFLRGAGGAQMSSTSAQNGHFCSQKPYEKEVLKTMVFCIGYLRGPPRRAERDLQVRAPVTSLFFRVFRRFFPKKRAKKVKKSIGRSPFSRSDGFCSKMAIFWPKMTILASLSTPSLDLPDLRLGPRRAQNEHF